MSREDSSISVVIVGVLGTIGPRHAISVSSCPDTTLLCVVDPSFSDTSAAARFDGVPCFTSVQHMLADHCVPDAAIVCSPTATHVSISQDLLAAGIHVLVEKPIAATIASARELVDTAARHDSPVLLVGHHRRFNPYVTATKRALPSIGRTIAVAGLWTTYKPASYFAPPAAWRAQPGSGGPILTNFVHEIDVLQYLLGPVIRVHAEQTVSQRGHAGLEEGAAILLRFANGVVGTFCLTDATPSPYNFESTTGENPGIAAHPHHDVLRVFGTFGTISMGDMQISTYGADVEKSWASPLSQACLEVSADQIPFDEQIRHLVSVIRGQEAPRCSGEDGLSALVVCDAVRRAMASGTAIEVTPP